MNGPSDLAILMGRSEKAEEALKIDTAIPIEMARAGLVATEMATAISKYIDSLPQARRREGGLRKLASKVLIRELMWRALSRNAKPTGNEKPEDVINNVVQSLKCIESIDYTHEFVWHEVAGVYYTSYILTNEIKKAGSVTPESVIAAISLAINDIGGEFGKAVKAFGFNYSTVLRKLMGMRKRLVEGIYTELISPTNIFIRHAKIEKCAQHAESAIRAYVAYSNHMLLGALNKEQLRVLDQASERLWKSTQAPLIVIPIFLAIIENDE